MIRRILLGVGGTPFSDVSIHRAVELAARHQASVTAVTVLDEARLDRVGPVPIGGGAAAAELREYRRSKTRAHIDGVLDLLSERCAAAQVPLALHREQGSPFELMIDHGRYHDLSIFGLRSMFEYDVLSDFDVDPAVFLRDLIGGGVRPLLASTDELTEIQRVLIAYSGSVHSAESMKAFIRLCPWPNVELRLLVCERSEEAAGELLAHAAAYCRAHGYEPQERHLPGDAKSAVLDEADEWNADLIVLGSSATSWLAAIFQETTMLHLVRHSPCSLFIGS